MFKELTEEQQEIIKHPGNSLVIAGPGTGKTFTLLQKIRFLTENLGINPEKILVLTYNLKNSLELREKIFEREKIPVKVDTFHGLAYDLWKEHLEVFPEIISEEKRKKILKTLFGKPPKILNSEQKKKFFAFLEKENLVDFELLLIKISEILKGRGLFKEYHVFVDEFQDLSPEILEFLKIFNGACFHFFGDPNQSIYSFKGVSLKAIKNFFDSFFSDLKFFSLSLSFRCPEKILALAQKFAISPWKTPEFSSVKKGGKIEGFFFFTPFSEKKHLLKIIKELLGGLYLENVHASQLAPSEIFVLSRIKQVYLDFKKFLEDEGIPVKSPEEEAKEKIDLIKDFVKTYKTSLFTEELIEKAPHEIYTLVKNLWNLSEKEKEKFLNYLNIIKPEELISPSSEGINFLSIHASKGLEAKIVILLGAEKGLLPLTIFPDTDPEEEKRLLYVALTRSKESFYFSVLKERKIFNFVLKEGISPYLKDLPLTRINPPKPKPKQQGLF